MNSLASIGEVPYGAAGASITISAADVYEGTADYPPELEADQARIIWSSIAVNTIGSMRESSIESFFVQFDCQALTREAADAVRSAARRALRRGGRARRLTSFNDLSQVSPPLQRALFDHEILA